MMSYLYIIGIKNSDSPIVGSNYDIIRKFPNTHIFKPQIWFYFGNKYLDKRELGEVMFLVESSDSELWKLVNPEYDYIPLFEKIILFSTLDYAVIKKENYCDYAHDLLLFLNVLEKQILHLYPLSIQQDIRKRFEDIIITVLEARYSVYDMITFGDDLVTLITETTEYKSLLDIYEEVKKNSKRNIHDIESLKALYIFKNPHEIENFLIFNRDLIPVLREGYKQIRKIFGDVPLYLELHIDPEEGWGELFIIIKSNCPQKELMEFEKKLFNTWYLKIMDKVSTRLNFTVEPKTNPPETLSW